MRPDATLTRAKRPGEEFPVSWDFVHDVPSGDSYGSFTISASVVSTGADVTATFLQSPARVGATGAIVIVQLQGGTDGLDYDVLFRLTTTLGHVFERVLRVQVRA